MRVCVIFAVLGGCSSTVVEEFETCQIDLTLTPAEGAPGAEIVATGTPLSEVRDTRVEVGGVAATVSAVVRDGCDTCDSCRSDAGCAPCGLCAGLALEAAARDACFGDPLADPPSPSSCDACVESMTFVVPDAPPGLTTVFVVNRNGQSLAIPFEVLPGASTTGDTGATAIGTGDTGGTSAGDTAADTSDTGTSTR
ncbi:MAG: hypothetical protein ABMB14_10545 [Myxococcota bacterium]